MDVPSIEVVDLFRRALIGLDEELDPSGAEPTGWLAITHLHRLGSREVLDVALAACAEPSTLHRRVGASVLGQLGHTKVGFEPVFKEERYRGLADLLAAERAGAGDPAMLADTCFALGHLHDPRAIATLLELLTHPEADVRRGVVSGLSGYKEGEAIDGLIALSEDVDEAVRDWAIFGLGQLIETDTPAIRAALRTRLDDPLFDARNEAIEGLATRGDDTALPALIRELSSGNVSSGLLQAAATLATPALCDALPATAKEGLTWECRGQLLNVTADWQAAMRACGCDDPTPTHD